MRKTEVAAAIEQCARGDVVLACDLRRAGVSDKEVLLARRAGLLERQLQGVYVRGGVAVDQMVKARVALAHAGEGALLTGLFAALLSALPWIPDPQWFHVLVGPDRRRAGSAEWILIRRCSWIDELAVRTVDGLPLPPVAQIVVDGARELTALAERQGRCPRRHRLQAVHGRAGGAAAGKERDGPHGARASSLP